jgi:hypothetical protein
MLCSESKQNPSNSSMINNNNKQISGLPITFNYNLIEKSIKTYKSHWNARDFDVKFVKNLKLDSQNLDFLKMVVNKMKISD